MSKTTTIEEALDVLVDRITVAGYGKADAPNPLIKKRDKQPFAGYEHHKQEALATIEQLVLEKVIGEDEANIVEEYEPTLAQRNKNSLRSEQRQALTQILRGSKN